ncbi:GNAT family N-acetyltransferase [Marinilactibacillus kalidii]|uniref:GNAT family N-acetyltransferase n=1 Tax=Marinilactibacillus kalidii TaxID=2820274 RepID=UPI001ABEB1E9|nr:GNAT family N-acetyltransferase [Marinilactibacillus kalidii]
MNVHFGKEKWHQAAAFYVRLQVFVLERGIKLVEEFDSDDHDETEYVVIYDEEKPVATGRYMQIDDQTIRLGRIAVLAAHRKHGLGQMMIEALEKAGRERGQLQVVIHGELTAASFYEQLGYRRDTDTYLEDGVTCVTLRKNMKEV